MILTTTPSLKFISSKTQNVSLINEPKITPFHLRGREGHFFRENTLGKKTTTQIDIKNFCSKIFRQNKKQV